MGRILDGDREIRSLYIMIHGVFSEDGYPLAFYDDTMHDLRDIPNDAVVISSADWMAFVAEPGRWVYDVRKKVRVAAPEEHIAAVKEFKIKQINKAAARDIFSKYPWWKQVNIHALHGYDEAKRAEMLEYIGEIREKANRLEKLVVAASNLREIMGVEW